MSEASQPQPQVGEEARPTPAAAPEDPSTNTEKTAPAEDAQQPNVTGQGEDPPPAEGDGAVSAGDADAAEGGKDGTGTGADPSSAEAPPATDDGDRDKKDEGKMETDEVNKAEEGGGVGGGGAGGDEGPPPKITSQPGPALPPPLDDIHMVNVSGVTSVDDVVSGAGKTRHLVEINSDGFTPEQLACLPVAFAYRLNDGGESERAAMVAQDDWYRQRRMEKEEEMARQSRAAATATGTQKNKSKTAPHKKTAEKKPARPDSTGRVRPYEIESIPAPDCPPGWIRKTFNRKSGDHVDKYWYTPKTSKKLRSRTEVNRFIQYLEQTGGDEDDAFDMLKNKPVGTSRRRSK